MKNKQISKPILITFSILALLLPLVLQLETNLLGQLSSESTSSSSSSVSSAPVQLTLEEVQKQVAQKQWDERLARIGTFREDVLKTNKTIDVLDEVAASFRKKRDELRSECRLEIRKASVYTMLSVQETCYKKELELERSILEKEKEYMQTVPGVSSDIRQLTVTRIELLYDALGVVINAIDNQVYESIEEIQEAKLALLQSYRTAKWHMYTRSHADQLLTRTTSIILRIGTIAEESTASPEMTTSILESLQCFNDAESKLKNAVSGSSYEQAKVLLEDAKMKLQECIESTVAASTMYEAPTDKVAEESSADTDTESGTSSTSSSVATVRTMTNGNTKTISDLQVIRIHNYDKLKSAAVTEEVIEEKLPGEQVNGPTPVDCNTDDLPRPLQKLIRQNPDSGCRIN